MLSQATGEKSGVKGTQWRWMWKFWGFMFFNIPGLVIGAILDLGRNAREDYKAAAKQGQLQKEAFRQGSVLTREFVEINTALIRVIDAGIEYFVASTKHAEVAKAA